MFQKHCLTREGHKCIAQDQRCECGKDMEYCDSKQHCMYAERLNDTDECPPVCDKGKVMMFIFIYIRVLQQVTSVLDVVVLLCYFRILSCYK